MKCHLCNSRKKVLDDLNLRCGKCGYTFTDRDKTNFLLRERKRLLICSFSFMFLIVLIFFFFVIPINYRVDSPIFKGNFTEEQKSNVMNIINDVKPEYLSKIKQIKIINPDYTNDWIGYNWNGFVIVEYEDDLNNLRDTICHEILHSCINAVNDEEFIVEDIARTNVCFKRN